MLTSPVALCCFCFPLPIDPLGVLPKPTEQANTFHAFYEALRWLLLSEWPLKTPFLYEHPKNPNHQTAEPRRGQHVAPEGSQPMVLLLPASRMAGQRSKPQNPTKCWEKQKV